MSLTVKLKSLDEQVELDQVNPGNNNNFTLSNSAKTDLIFEIEYILPLHNQYKPDDYTLFILKSDYLNKENDIFQIYEKDLGERGRIGWIFPIQALISKEHDYSEDPHFLKYAYVTFLKLLINSDMNEANTPNIEYESESICLTDFYEDDLIIVSLSNDKFSKIESFNIENYLISFYSQGYYYPPKAQKYEAEQSLENQSSAIEISANHNKRIYVQKITQYLEGEPFLQRLFKGFLKMEKHPLVKFHLLYQVVELLIERIFDLKLQVLIQEFSDSKNNKNRFEMKEKLNRLSNEKERVKILFHNTNINYALKTSLHESCTSLLSNYSEAKEDLADSLYSVRSFIVHNFRRISETDMTLIEQINSEFEPALIAILLNYDEQSCQ